MAAYSALLIGDPNRTRTELANALLLAGYTVKHLSPAEMTEPADPAFSPSLLLASATIGLKRIAMLGERFASGSGQLPNTMVYLDGDIIALELCVRGGFDYLTPPFSPGLLRTRLSTCWERGQLTMAVEEMASAASLRSYERDLSIAREIQAGFLPEELPVPAGWQVAEKFRPAEMVGGDFYDVFELAGGRRLALVVADVADKGVGAALFMALIRTLLRNTAEQAGAWTMMHGGQPPRQPSGLTGAPLAPALALAAGPLLEAVSGTNSYMARHHQRQAYFCTMFFGALDPQSGALVYINGGHNPPVLVRADGQHHLLDPTGPAVGMFPSSSYLLGHTTLQPGDQLFVYTDGVTEARAPDGGMFGTNRMLDVVLRPTPSAHALLDAVDDAVTRYVGTAEQSDDITMLALRRARQR